MCPHALCFILDTYSVPTFNNVYCTLTFLRPKVPVLWSPTLDTSNARIFTYLLCCLHKLEEYEYVAIQYYIPFYWLYFYHIFRNIWNQQISFILVKNLILLVSN